MENTPLISVITVTYNAVSVIKETITSIINQPFDNFEYIVIDGNSKDGTQALIEEKDPYGRNFSSAWIKK